jgi:flagellar hook protein FlgE
MGLNTFLTGLSGLNSNSQGLNVVGNNLANLNTVGFKASNISFTDVLGQVFGTSVTAQSGSLTHVGLGSHVSGVRAVFSQGGVQASNNPLDVAIQGKGLLVVNDGANGTRHYTRAGNMHLDAGGSLVSEQGFNVQGYIRNPATGLIDPNGGLQDISVPSGLMPATPTTEFELGMNLDANAATGTQFSTTMQLYDSLGKAHMATMTFQKEISGGASPVTKWRFDLTIPRNEIAGVAANNTEKFSLITGAVATTPPAAGALVFDANGIMTSSYIGADPATPPAPGNLTVPPTTITLPQLANGASLSPQTWKLLSSGAPTITALATASEITSTNQNGSAPGTLLSVSIETDGKLAGVFSNGKTMNIAQIVLADFANLDGLITQGGGLYAESPASGAVHLGVPGEGSRGRLMSGALEQSNVDLAAELTKIITYQRGYQANARIITATDQILQETMNLMN